MKNLSAVFAICLLIISCSEAEKEKKGDTEVSEKKQEQTSSTYNPDRGEGKYNEQNVVLASINPLQGKKGEEVAGTKCFACHKITGEKLVGPGWKGVTTRRKPYWILNFITNPDPMIDKDPKVQAQLETCLVRMPNQNLNDEEAKQVLEFMRMNDSK